MDDFPFCLFKDSCDWGFLLFNIELLVFYEGVLEAQQPIFYIFDYE